tara:strand:+ start:51 stop:251 length:201 start_codon:yes stop_codon:yes gene_type:complete
LEKLWSARAKLLRWTYFGRGYLINCGQQLRDSICMPSDFNHCIIGAPSSTEIENVRMQLDGAPDAT